MGSSKQRQKLSVSLGVLAQIATCARQAEIVRPVAAPTAYRNLMIHMVAAIGLCAVSAQAALSNFKGFKISHREAPWYFKSSAMALHFGAGYKMLSVLLIVLAPTITALLPIVGVGSPTLFVSSFPGCLLLLCALFGAFALIVDICFPLFSLYMGLFSLIQCVVVRPALAKLLLRCCVTLSAGVREAIGSRYGPRKRSPRLDFLAPRAPLFSRKRGQLCPVPVDLAPFLVARCNRFGVCGTVGPCSATGAFFAVRMLTVATLPMIVEVIKRFHNAALCARLLSRREWLTPLVTWQEAIGLALDPTALGIGLSRKARGAVATTLAQAGGNRGDRYTHRVDSSHLGFGHAPGWLQPSREHRLYCTSFTLMGVL